MRNPTIFIVFFWTDFCGEHFDLLLPLKKNKYATNFSH